MAIIQRSWMGFSLLAVMRHQFLSTEKINCVIRMKLFNTITATAVIGTSLIAASPAWARSLNVPDGQYTGFSEQQKVPVFVVVRSGRIESANFRPVSGCDSSNPNWSCTRVEANMKKIGPCELRWTIPWEQDFYYQVDIKNHSCNY